MTTPQTELDRAAEDVKRALIQESESIQTLLLTAKRVPELEQRVKEVERKNGDLEASLHQLQFGKYGTVELKQELSTIRTSYKEALNALHYLLNSEDVPDKDKSGKPYQYSFQVNSPFHKELKSVLSSPAAIAAMKGETQ